MMLTMKSTVLIIALSTYYTSMQVYAKEAHLRGATPSYSRLISEENNNNACSVGVTLSCPTPEELTLDNDCVDPFQVITFRYNSGDCNQSDNLNDRHNFICTDLNSGGPTSSEGSESYIVVTSKSGNETYFSGSVAVGEEYTLNANELYDILIADMTITIYNTEGGNILQTTELRLDCSNSLFLFDKFGASQVTSWKEISGREITSTPETNRNGKIEIIVDNQGTSPIRLIEMTLLSNTEDIPINYTSEVQDIVLQQTNEVSLIDYQFNYDLATRTRYTFFTTIIAELVDGDETNQCNNYFFIECIL